MKSPRCSECKQKVIWGDLRGHWELEHPEKLRAIDKWLGRAEDKARSWERWQKEVEEGMVGERLN